MESRLRLVGRVFLSALLLLLGIAPLGVEPSSASVSPCPLRDPGPHSGWVRVPADFWTVMEAVEAAVQQGLYRVWIGPGYYAFSLPELGTPFLQKILLCGLGPGFTVLLHRSLPQPQGLPPYIQPQIVLSPKEGEGIVLEGFTLIGGAVRISAEEAAQVTLRHLHVLAPGDLQPRGWTGITITLVEEGAQVLLEEVTVQGAGTGVEVHNLGPGEVLLKRVLTSGNGRGMGIAGDGRTIIFESRIVYNAFPGILTDGRPHIIIRNSEIAYNGGEGIGLGADTYLEVYDSRIFANGGYGIRMVRKECGYQGDGAEGVEVRGRGNEIFDNAKGDLCPEDYPWPEGFRKP